MPEGADRSHCLVADVGGTNVRFALAPIDAAGPLVEERAWRLADFDGPDAAVRAYLQAVAPVARPRAGMLAIAAPVDGDEIGMINGHWRFSLAETRRSLGFDHLHALNDFAANAWAVAELDRGDLLGIGAATPDPAAAGSFLVLGTGTGLGVASLRRDLGGRLTIGATEGGHVAFGPLDEQEDALLARLRPRFGRLSYERLLSGPGLTLLHQVRAGGPDLAPELIIGRAAAGEAEAERSVDLFCAILGSFAGDAALIHGAWNGLHLAGSMINALAAPLAKGAFRRRFEAKGRYAARLAAIPTAIVLQPALGLLGAAGALRHQLAENQP
ncbi:glucokinase [Sphingomonas sp.]|uniref:glucokinase n=1 Tax=Sphingomonas sp. TaxID=28214 RepID=UPI002FC76B8B